MAWVWILWCGLGWAVEPMGLLHPYDAIRGLRSTLFAETHLVTNGPAGSECSKALSLTPQMMKNACGDAADYVAFSLIAQGVSPMDVRISGFDHARRRTSHWDVFIGKRAPGHLFAVWRTPRAFVVLDPTFFQFHRTKLVKALRENPLGSEILGDLRRFGYWVVTPERWSAFLQAFAQEYEEVRSIGFDELAANFERFTLFDLDTGPPPPVVSSGFTSTLRAFNKNRIEQRIGPGSTSMPFLQIESAEWADLDRELSWPLVRVR